jgi:hypothetical protein
LNYKHIIDKHKERRQGNPFIAHDEFEKATLQFASLVNENIDKNLVEEFSEEMIKMHNRGEIFIQSSKKINKVTYISPSSEQRVKELMKKYGIMVWNKYENDKKVI